MRIFKKLLLPLVLLLSVSLTSCGISDFLFPSSEISETIEEDSIEVNGKYIRLELEESSFELVFGVEATFKEDKVVKEFNVDEFQIEEDDVYVRDLLDTAFDEKLILEEDPKYGSFLTGIEGYFVRDKTKNYISILINGGYSDKGINIAPIAGVETIELILVNL